MILCFNITSLSRLLIQYNSIRLVPFYAATSLIATTHISNCGYVILISCL